MPDARVVKAVDCQRFIADLREAAARYRECYKQAVRLHPDRMTHGDLLLVHKGYAQALLTFAEIMESLADREERLMDTDGRRYQECCSTSQT